MVIEVSSEVSMGLYCRAALRVSNPERAVSSFLMISCPIWQQRFLLNGIAIRKRPLKLARNSLGYCRTVIAPATLAVRERVGRHDYDLRDCCHDQKAFNSGSRESYYDEDNARQAGEFGGTDRQQHNGR